MIDSSESEEIIRILEEMDDQSLVVSLLNDFNKKTSHLGKLLLNQDPNLDHEEWKSLCDKAKRDVDQVIAKIKSL